MTQTFSGDGRTVGSVMILQALLVQILAQHPDKDAMLASIRNFAEGMDADAQAAGASGEPDEFMFLTDIADGMKATVRTIDETVAAVIAAKL